MRKLVISCFFLFCCGYEGITQTVTGKNYAQEKEKLARAAWKQEKISKEILWKYYQFQALFGAKQSINILDVDLNNRSIAVKIIQENSTLLPTSTLGRKAGGMAAVNGNFFHTEEGGSVCFLKIDGKIVDTSRTDLTERLFLDQLDDGALVIDSSGIVKLLSVPTSGWKSLHQFPTIISSGPMLLQHGKVLNFISHSFNDKRYGRTGIGLTSNNHLLLITADGNTSGAAGMSIREFATVFDAFGCESAINLDGGGSSAMWIKGKPFNGIVNYPSDNKKFDHKGERAVANALVIVVKQ